MGLGLFASGIAIVTSGIVSLILFFKIKKDHLLSGRTFFIHWTAGFFFFGFAHIAAVAVNVFALLGKTLTYQNLVVFLIIAFLSSLIANTLFYRGTVLLITEKEFWTTTLPLGMLVTFLAMMPVLFFAFKLPVPIILAMYIIEFVSPINLFIIVTFLWAYLLGRCFTERKHGFSLLFISFAWIMIFLLDIIVWWILWNYPFDFWIVRFAELEKWYFARALSHIIALIGLIFMGRNLPLVKILKASSHPA